MLPNLRFELRIHQRHGAIDRHRMPAVVGRVVTERAEREGVLVDVLRIAYQRFDEIAGADVVQQVAEEMAAERVVAKVLDDAAAVRVGARFEQLAQAWRLESAPAASADRACPRPHRCWLRGRAPNNRRPSRGAQRRSGHDRGDQRSHCPLL